MGADTVSQGAPQRQFGNEGIVLDAVDNIIYSFGQNQIPQPVSAVLQASGIGTPLTNITTAQTLFSKLLSKGLLNRVGASLTVYGQFVYSTTAGNLATLTIALTLGGVTLATITTTATNTAASTNLPVNFEFSLTVASIGAAGTIVTVGNVTVNLGTAAAAAAAAFLSTGTTASAAINLTAAQTLAVTIAASAAVPSVTLLNGVAQLLS